MVILGIVICFFNMGGVGLSSTLIYEQLRTKFGKSAVETAWVNSIQGAFRFISSPLASASCNRFGVRATVIVGAVFSAAGLLASAFPPSLYYVYFFYGVMTGFGTSLVVTSCFIIVGQYFDKKRGKANAVATMGGAMGGMVITPCVTLMFAEYGFSGTLILLAAFFFHFFISAALFRPVEANYRPGAFTKNIKLTASEDQPVSEQSVGESQERVKQSLMSKKELKTNSLLEGESSNERMGSSLELTEPTQFGSSVSFSNDAAKESESKDLKKKRHICSKYFNLSLLRSKEFLSFTLLMVCVFLSFALNATFLAGLCKERGITDSYLAIVFIINSLTGLASRLLAGIAFDIGFIKRWRLLIFCIWGFMHAISMALLPLSHDFSTFLIPQIPKSILGSAFHSQHLTILADIVGVKKLPSAIGLCRFFMGLGQILGPTIGGLLRDQTGQYGPAYMFGGSAVGFGIIVFVVLNFKKIFHAASK